MTPTEKATFESILSVYVGRDFHQECREKMELADPKCMRCRYSMLDMQVEPCKSCELYCNFKLNTHISE